MNPYQRQGRFGGGLLPQGIKILLILNVAVYILFWWLSPAEVKQFIYEKLFLWPTGGPSNAPSHFYFWQLITYQFIHAKDIFHILFNMFALWMFGVEIERTWGTSKFIIFYLLSGIGAGLTQIFIAPMLSEAGPTIGASGAVFGILVAYALMFPNRPVFMFPIFIPIPAKYFVLGYAAINLLMALNPGSANIAWFAHIGGAVTGFLLFKYGDRLGIYHFFDKIFKTKSSGGSSGFGSGAGIYDKFSSYKSDPYNVEWEKPGESHKEKKETKTHTSPFSVDGEEITQARIDEILDKISNSGYQNLTEKEKQILFELSQKLK